MFIYKAQIKTWIILVDIFNIDMEQTNPVVNVSRVIQHEILHAIILHFLLGAKSKIVAT